MGLPLRDTAYHTYADYLTWPEDVRYELIDGVAYLMGPAPVRVHQEIVGEIFRQTANALEGRPCRAYVAPFDVRLPKGNEADAQVDTVVQPDVLVVCDEAKLDERGMRGAPDWVVEVLSPSSAGHDQTVKLAAYERAGVAEVWLVHPTDRVVTVYRLEGRSYGRAAIHEMTDSLAVGVLPGVCIDWERVPGRPATAGG
ncbi:MAG TPA: Uma2 family endonuclease [Rhodocyclaceae bacterium]|nr:Uma2 family endonuclease [Rhodocyclaceae bacterium]